VSQRDLAGVENGEYRLKPSRCRIDPLLTAAADRISTHPAASGRPIRVESAPENLEIVTDRGLLMRVVGNLLKNAVEAESVGTAVRVGGAARADGGAEIWVRNPTAMPREVQLQLFQRAFTTKGAGRGQGTYSVRLLTERYLGGEVAFRSDSLPAAVVSLDDAVGEVPPLE
jgi:signal transduction histidine kinase